jgi:hypothetical protein
MVASKSEPLFRGFFLAKILNKNPLNCEGVWLPDEDSNLDKQNQNLSYYLYTIGQ